MSKNKKTEKIKFTRINEVIRRNKEITSSQKLLIGYLNDYQLNGLTCYQTAEELAYELGISVSSINRDVTKLVAKGLVKRGSFSEMGVDGKKQYKNRKATVYIGDKNLIAEPNDILKEEIGANQIDIVQNEQKQDSIGLIETVQIDSFENERKQLGAIFRELTLEEFNYFKEGILPPKLKDLAIIEYKNKDNDLILKSKTSNKILCSSKDINAFYNYTNKIETIKKVLNTHDGKVLALEIMNGKIDDKPNYIHSELRLIYKEFNCFYKQKGLELPVKPLSLFSGVDFKVFDKKITNNNVESNNSLSHTGQLIGNDLSFLNTQKLHINRRSRF